MKTVVAKFSGGGLYTCKYYYVDHPREWHAENVPGFEGSDVEFMSEYSVENVLRKLAASAGQTVEITVEGEAVFAER